MNRTRLQRVLNPLLLVLWLGALWACMSPLEHKVSHEGASCAAVHSTVAQKTLTKIADVVHVIRVIVVTAFLSIVILVTSFDRSFFVSAPRRERHKRRPAQPNAPPALTFA